MRLLELQLPQADVMPFTSQIASNSNILQLTVITLLCSSMYVCTTKKKFKPNTELAFFSAGHNIKISHSTYFGSLGNGVIDQICFFRDATTMSCWQQPVAKKEWNQRKIHACFEVHFEQLSSVTWNFSLQL